MGRPKALPRRRSDTCHQPWDMMAQGVGTGVPRGLGTPQLPVTRDTEREVEWNRAPKNSRTKHELKPHSLH